MNAFTSLDQWLKERTRRARTALGLRVDCEYRARAGKLSSPPSALHQNAVSVRVVSETGELAAYEARCTKVNPAPSGFSGRGIVAVAERDGALVGYWWFLKRDGDLYDRGGFVVPEMRGKRVIEQLLRAGAATTTSDSNVYVTTSLANWAARRVVERIGMQRIRISASCAVPWFGEATLYPSLALDVDRKSGSQ